MLAMEFGRLAAERGYLGLEWERFRKAARVLQRTPDVVAEGFNAITDDAVSRGHGGAEIGVVEIAFLVFAGLTAGAINEDLGRRCFQLYNAKSEHFPDLVTDATGRKRQPKAQCPVTHRQRAGDAVRDVLADPDLAAKVESLTLWREASEITLAWKDGQRSVFAPRDVPPERLGLFTEATMPGAVLLAIAEATRGQHPISQRREN